MKKILAVLGAMVLSASVGMYYSFSFTENTLRNNDYIRDQISETIAIVSLDDGVDVNGVRQYYANDFINLLGNDSNYVVESASGAQAGLSDGKYGAVITFPSNTSECILSLNSATPVSLPISYTINPKLDSQSYINVASKIGDFQNDINDQVSYMYVSSILSELHGAQDQAGQLLVNNDEILSLLEDLELMDYVDSLEIGSVPALDFQPEGLNIEGYMNEADRLANDISGYYLSSYQSALRDYSSMNRVLTASAETLRGNASLYFDELNSWRDSSAEQNECVSNYNTVLLNYYAELSGCSLQLEDEIDQFNDNINSFNNWYLSVNRWYNQLNSYSVGCDESRDAFFTSSAQAVAHAQSLADENQENLDALDAYRESLEAYYTSIENLNEVVGEYNVAVNNLNSAVDNVQNCLGGMTFSNGNSSTSSVPNTDGQYTAPTDSADNIDSQAGSANTNGAEESTDGVVPNAINDQYNNSGNNSLDDNEPTDGTVPEAMGDHYDYNVNDTLVDNEPTDGVVPNAMSDHYDYNVNDASVDNEPADGTVPEAMGDQNTNNVNANSDCGSGCDTGNSSLSGGNNADPCAMGTANEQDYADLRAAVEDLKYAIEAYNTIKGDLATAINAVTIARSNLPEAISFNPIDSTEFNASVTTMDAAWAEYNEIYSNGVPAYSNPYQPMSGEYELEMEVPVLAPLECGYEIQPVPEMDNTIYTDMDQFLRVSDSYNPLSYLSTDVEQLVSARIARFSDYSYGIENMMNASYESNINRMRSSLGTYTTYVNNMRSTAINNYNDEQEAFQASVTAYGDGVRAINEENAQLIGSFSTVMPNSRSGSDVNTNVVNAIIQPVVFDNQSDLMTAEVTSFNKVTKPLKYVMIGSGAFAGIFAAWSAFDAIRKRRA